MIFIIKDGKDINLFLEIGRTPQKSGYVNIEDFPLCFSVIYSRFE